MTLKSYLREFGKASAVNAMPNLSGSYVEYTSVPFVAPFDGVAMLNAPNSANAFISTGSIMMQSTSPKSSTASNDKRVCVPIRKGVSVSAAGELNSGWLVRCFRLVGGG